MEYVAIPAASAARPGQQHQHGFVLFLVGFLVLFLELACIRWFAATVVFLQFFTNVVLIASFLGMSCGCLAARRRHDWLGDFPAIALATVLAALLILGVYNTWRDLAIDVGGQAAPQEVFFGTEARNPDVAKFVVPIEAVAAFFFVMLALMFVGLGQVLGRAFDAYPDRVRAYTFNIGGSLAGIVGFSILSFCQAPPGLWFLVSCGGIGYLVFSNGALTRMRVALLVMLVGLIAVPLDWLTPDREIRWSPYYRVDHSSDGNITVNTIGHQFMLPFEKIGASYSLIHLLQQHSGGKPFQDVLIIGAGSGNDVTHAERFGVGRIDAVEIDPVIQDTGIHYHPNHPYQDPRVVPHLDDGRHFLRTTDRQYDLVVYALVDSLILHSGYANLRLESYLFTQQALDDVRRVLKPGGTFVVYNYMRQGWIVERIAAMMEKSFGCPPVVLSLPYKETLRSSERADFIVMIAGCGTLIPDAFRAHGSFWLNTTPMRNLDIDGFNLRVDAMSPAEKRDFQKIAPTKLVHDGGPVLSASDDWPFLYLHSPLVPDFTLRSMALLGALGLGFVYLFMPRGRFAIDNRMFFLGAAFMLLETKSVVQMALLFGSTWLVNALVFFTVLVLILLANLCVLKLPKLRLPWCYAALLAFLAVDVAVPLDAFLEGGLLWRYAVPCFLSLGPIFFAGLIFARSFRDTLLPDTAFGSNIAGAVVGGLCEAFSAVLGFRYLLLVAIAFYLLSAWLPLGRRATAPAVPSI